MALNNPFAPLYKLCDNAMKIDVSKVFIKVIFKDEIRVFILDLNRIEQLYKKSEDSYENFLGTYSYATERITKGRKKAGSSITLLDTGAFYKSFDIAVYSDESFTIEANTVKEDGTDLASSKRYGKGILGLSDESKGKLIEKILPEIITEVRKQILK
jgi:archaellin